MGTAPPSNLKHQTQQNQFNFNINTFRYIVYKIQANNGQQDKFLNQFHCMILNHATNISTVCIHPQCIAQNRKCCIYCILEELHHHDDAYNIRFITSEWRLEQIINDYKVGAQKQMEKIDLYILIIELQIIDEKEKFIKQEMTNKNNNLKKILDYFEGQFNKISIQDYVNQLQGNPNLFKYLRDNFLILQDLYPFLIRYSLQREELLNKQQLNEMQDNEQNQQQHENIRKFQLETLCKILQNRIYQKGEIDYEQSEIIEKQIQIILKIALDYASENHYDDALQICDIISQLDKYQQKAYQNKEIILEMQKKNQEAFMKKFELLQIDWGQQFKYEELIRVIDDQLIIDNRQGIFLKMKGLALQKLEKYKISQDTLKEAVGLCPDDKELYMLMEINEFKIQDIMTEMKCTDDCISQNIDKSKRFYQKGNQLLKLQLYDLAIQSYQKTLDNDSKYFEAICSICINHYYFRILQYLVGQRKLRNIYNQSKVINI